MGFWRFLTKRKATAPAPEVMGRDAEDDALARQWAEEARRLGEQGDLKDDTEYLKQVLAEEKRKTAHQ